MDSMETRAVFSDALLLEGIEKLILPDVRIERFLTRLRQWFLDRALAGTVPADMMKMLRALSIQCFFNEYVCDVSPAEEESVRRLAGELAAAPPDLETASAQACILILSSYEPLYRWAGEKLGAALESRRGILEDIVLVQWTEPREERKIAAEIPSVVAIADEVSRKVQAQYEENPYPRWRYINWGGASYMPPEIDLKPRETSYDILIAGCGTGRQPLMTASNFTHSDIVAVDLSRASLSYATRKAREIGVENVHFMQGDILGLGALEKRFDLIECAGVLHHMDDPEAGWRVLNGLLKPGGYMLIGLYSETARQHIVTARRYIADWGLGSDVASIRQARQKIMDMNNPDMERLLRSHDFYTTSTCRDLIFHVQEHRFTLPQIGAILKRLGLDFKAFAFQTTEPILRYREMFAGPDKEADTADLANWHEFEQKYPHTFAGMYQFWVRKV